MITGKYWEILDKSEIDSIENAAITLLSKGGIEMDFDALLVRMEAAGCRIDKQEKKFFIPESLVSVALNHYRKKSSMNVSINAGWKKEWGLWHGGSYPHLLDWPDCNRRLATNDDIVKMAKMAHMLEEFEGVGKVLTSSEVDQRIEPLWSMLQIAMLTDKKIGCTEVYYPSHVGQLVRMGEVITGEAGSTSLVAPCDAFLQPLKMDRRQAECFIEKRKYGIMNVPATMPVAGISAPITCAGVCTVALAEIIAGWVMGYVIAPDVPVGAIVSSGTLDMQTMRVLFASPEAILNNVAVSNLIKERYGIDVWCITNYCDATYPGMNAAFQKMFGTIGASLAGPRTVCADGILSGGQDYSPVQHILDREMGRAVDRFWGHYEVNDTTLAVEEILGVMKSGSTNFLNNEHTLFNFQEEHFYPRWFDRTTWIDQAAEIKAEHDLYKRINDYCQKAINDYTQPEIDSSKIRELEQIVRTSSV